MLNYLLSHIDFKDISICQIDLILLKETSIHKFIDPSFYFIITICVIQTNYIAVFINNELTINITQFNVAIC